MGRPVASAPASVSLPMKSITTTSGPLASALRTTSSADGIQLPESVWAAPAPSKSMRSSDGPRTSIACPRRVSSEAKRRNGLTLPPPCHSTNWNRAIGKFATRFATDTSTGTGQPNPLDVRTGCFGTFGEWLLPNHLTLDAFR